MDEKPAEIIKQAKQKAENALVQCIGDEVQRICDAFMYDTGLNVRSIDIDFFDASSIGGNNAAVINRINIVHGGI